MAGRGKSLVDIPSESLTERELLIAMRGELALIRKDNEQTQKDLTAVRDRGHEISNSVQAMFGELSTRIRTLETASIASQNFAKGETQGFNKAVKAIYALAAVCGLGGVATAIKVFLPSLGG